MVIAFESVAIRVWKDDAAILGNCRELFLNQKRHGCKLCTIHIWFSTSCRSFRLLAELAWSERRATTPSCDFTAYVVFCVFLGSLSILHVNGSAGVRREVPIAGWRMLVGSACGESVLLVLRKPLAYITHI